jgi:hypothetical protein
MEMGKNKLLIIFVIAGILPFFGHGLNPLKKSLSFQKKR